jgi:hypothetical protein
LLWPDWSAIYNDLTRFHDLLVVLPSPAVILGTAWQGFSLSPRSGRGRDFFCGLSVEPQHAFREFRATEIIREEGRSFFISALSDDGGTALKICLRPGQPINDFVTMVALNQGVGAFGPLPGRVAPARSHWCPSFQEARVSEAPSIESCFKLWIHAEVRIRVTLTRPHLSLATSFVPTKWKRDSEWFYVTDGFKGLHLNTLACRPPKIASGCVASGTLIIPTADAATLFTIQTEGLG